MHINKAFQQKLAEHLLKLTLLSALQGSYNIFIWRAKGERTEKKSILMLMGVILNSLVLHLLTTGANLLLWDIASQLF